MSRRRTVADGLPHRVYERRGLKVYSVGYKRPDGSWAFRLKCAANDARAIAGLRRDAIRRSLTQSADGSALETVAHLFSDWIHWQRDLPAKSTRKRADTTMAENAREAKTLVAVFGEMAIVDIRPHHAYTYLDKCDVMGRGPKANKEISLFQLVLQSAVRKGIIDANPLKEVEKLATAPSSRYVEHSELALALEVGKRNGGQMHRAALALSIGYLCLRRSTEVLSLQWSRVLPEGIDWTDGKAKAENKKHVLISWSDELRGAIEALKLLDGLIETPLTGFVFRTQKDTRYTRGGWKATLRRLMEACQIEANARGVSFQRFNLQDQRPKGVTDKIEDKHTDVQDATLHKNARMIQAVYDRRRKVVATPAR